MSTFEIDHSLTIDNIAHLLEQNTSIKLSAAAKQRIEKCHHYLQLKIEKATDPIYGVNTGFGALCNTGISNEKLSTLQENLLRSHACGTGQEVPQHIVKIMLLLKIQSLSYGHSGVQTATVELLTQFYNHSILPIVYEQGSLGASGDLAPLAHLCLPLIGEGEVWYNGEKTTASKALTSAGLNPVQLGAKEGLALINGTQFMSAYGVWCLLEAKKLSNKADEIAALSIDAFDGRIDPFHEALHRIRAHKGQIATAKRIKELLAGSEINAQPKTAVQDPYAFRCIPQVHGASKDAISYVHSVFETEINSVTDNPNVFPDEDLILSGGNFHGQPLAITLDFLAIALAELGSISERRTYQMISGQRQLPAFLTPNPGLHSGLMIPQYTAASIVSQNKQLCSPASVDSIVSSNGQEDHVSMGANAATKCLRVVNNLRTILAIELLNASQALEFRRPLKTSPYLEELFMNYRKHVPFIEQDRKLYEDIHASEKFLKS
jgi:histidine ammonia-lyase